MGFAFPSMLWQCMVQRSSQALIDLLALLQYTAEICKGECCKRVPDYSENMVNINQIERKSFKIAANNLDGYKRRQI